MRCNFELAEAIDPPPWRRGAFQITAISGLGQHLGPQPFGDGFNERGTTLEEKTCVRGNSFNLPLNCC
jgi:hypothetical protein